MRKLFIAAAVVCMIAGCARTVREQSETLFAMDTVMDLKVYSNSDTALSDAHAEIMRLDALLDRGDSAGDIYRINTEKTAVVSSETADILRTAIATSEETDGAFDITTAPLSDLWGFYNLDFRIPTDGEILSALDGVGYQKIQLTENTITIPENTAIDLGGIAKGYASDRVVDVLRASGVSSAIISLGGNVHALGSRTDGRDWSVGITDPDDKNRLIGTVNVRDKAVITSGSYQRFFERDGVTYHHIIDPATGKSAASGLKSVTVIADSGIRADSLSTALFVMGLDKSAELWRKNGGFDAVFVTDGGSVYITDGIRGAFKSSHDYSIISLSDK